MPRRRLRRTSSKPKHERSRKPLDRRETEIRQVIRGLREPMAADPSAWERELRTTLDSAQIRLPHREMVEHWRHAHGDETCATMLLASLTDGFAAAETIMPAAMMLAEAEESVLLIDLDDQQRLMQRLGIAAGPGVADLLSPESAHGRAIHPTATPRLHVVGLGASPPTPTMKPNVIARMMSTLAGDYAWILVTASRSASPLTLAFARACQATYVLAPLGDSDASMAQTLLTTLRNAGGRVLGSIVVDSCQLPVASRKEARVSGQ
jgi:Mrp family chromosome partitioning ATPase